MPKPKKPKWPRTSHLVITVERGSLVLLFILLLPLRWAGWIARTASKIPRLAVVGIPALVATTWVLLSLATSHSFQREVSASGESQPPTRYATAFGEHRQVHLKDGTTVDLNSETTIWVQFSSTRRRVDVETGEALFHVYHETARPFRATAGAMVADDVATEFDLYVMPMRHLARLVVISGRVRVSRRVLGSDNPGQDGATFSAAQQVEIPDRADGPTRVKLHLSPQDLTRVSAWTEGRIEFAGGPLRQALEEIKRYNHVEFDVADSRIANLSLGGAATTTDVVSFLNGLQDLCVGYTTEHSDAGQVTYRLEHLTKLKGSGTHCKP